MTARYTAIAVSLVGIVAIVLLYFGNFSFQKKDAGDTQAGVQGLSFDDFERLQLKNLSSLSLDTFQNLRSSQDYERLASFWGGHDESLKGYYIFKQAEKTKHYEDYKMAGQIFFSALSEPADTIIRNNLITFAVRSFEKALALHSDEDTKLQLATVYVEATPEPMKGIALLRQITDSVPNHIPANMLLGRFAIMSGQFDKAEKRFNTILSQNPGNAEALYFMAQTQEGLGNNENAIELLELCKKIVNNKDFSVEIDEYIKGLKNK